MRGSHPGFHRSTFWTHGNRSAKDAKIAFAKMQAGDYDEAAAEKKLEDEKRSNAKRGRKAMPAAAGAEMVKKWVGMLVAK